MFETDPRLIAGSRPVAALALCDARLQDDERWPWIVLVPRRSEAVEIEDLPPMDRRTLLEEAVLAGQAVRAVGEALGRPVAKLNLGQLGNVTPQLHVHVVGRREDDAAWPGPVWGVGEAQPYDPEAQAHALDVARRVLLAAGVSHP